VTHEQLLRKIGNSWQDLLDSYAGLSDLGLLEPGVVGAWSVRDIIAHVTVWEEELLKHLPLVAAGGRPPKYSHLHGGIDAFNAKMTKAKRGVSLEEVIRERDRTHAKVARAVAALPEDQVRTDTPARRRIRLETYSHYAIHAAAIRRWRAQRDAGSTTVM
jgi:hypothetical protein